MRKVSLIASTVRHLTFTQIKYQLWYRIKPLIPIRYPSGTRKLFPLSFSHLDLIPHRNKYIAANSFCFLNLSQSFSQIDWSFQGHGKLWNYNLQYFDYLHDTEMAEVDKRRLIDDYSSKLLDGSLAPEPYPVSLRLINWLLYAGRSGYRSDVFERAINFQVNFLRRNKEYHLLANHLLENLVALVVAGYALRDKELVKQNMEQLERELHEQILDDGAHYEGSPMYHAIILSRLLVLVAVIRENGLGSEGSGFLESTVRKMLGWMQAFIFSNGQVPHMNDSTNGIAPEPHVLFKVSRELDLIADRRPMRESGYRKMIKDGFEAVLDIGNIVPSYQPGHAHSDMLHLCLNYKEKAVLVDTGISTYEVCERRYIERGTSSHNTVTVDDRNQSEVWGSFRVGRRARIEVHVDEPGKVSASHDGYKKMPGCIHTRTFEFGTGFVIRDALSVSSRSRTAVAHFHFDHTLRPESIDAMSYHILDGLKITFEQADRVEREEYWQAVGFNSLQKAFKLKAYFQHTLVTTIIPN